MATAPAATAVGVAQEDALVVPCTWRGYTELLRARGELPSPLYTYLRGRLTIVSPDVDHATLRDRVAAMLRELVLAAGFPARCFGTVTLRGVVRLGGGEEKTGTEPDISYYLRDIQGVSGKKKIRMGVDPPPHLAVEVVVSHDPSDQLEVLHAYKVPEVWVCRGGAVVILKRHAATGGPEWDDLVASEALPFVTADELTRWAYDPEENDAAFDRRFRAWVEAEIKPRVRP